MGLSNQSGALFFATGIDTTGVRKGGNETLGILRSLTKEVTSLDIFAGLGVSAALAFAKAGKTAYNFSKEMQQSMREVATLSTDIKDNLSAYQKSLIDLTTEIPVGANESAKAL